MTNLYAAKKRISLEIISAPDIALLNGLGIRKGVKIEIQDRYAFGGPVLLKAEDAYCIAVGKDIASRITVEELKTCE